MSDIESLLFDPAQFSGKVRLFPLPNLVLFPHVMQPLHIFEPRYRAMLEDAVADDRLIATAMLAPGWEKDYEGRPPLRPVACLGRVATWQKTEGNRYNVLLLGLRRVKLVRELPPKRAFREAEVDVWEDVYSPESATERPDLQRALVECFKRALPALAEGSDQLEQLLGSDVPLGMLTDIIGYTLDLDVLVKERLLAEPDVDLRAKLLVEQLQQAGQSGSPRPSRFKFPPEFSAN